MGFCAAVKIEYEKERGGRGKRGSADERQLLQQSAEAPMFNDSKLSKRQERKFRRSENYKFTQIIKTVEKKLRN